MTEKGEQSNKKIVRRYLRYLKLERNYSPNTILAYEHDINHLLRFCQDHQLQPLTLNLENLQQFSQSLSHGKVKPTSQARILAGVRSFYTYLTLEGYIDSNPSEFLETPQRGNHLPDVLTVEEVDSLEASIDLSKNEGHRNRAIIEILFSCGLRVSELVNLKLSNIYPKEKILRVIGKGNKERLVPISSRAMQELQGWFEYRSQMKIKSGEEDYVFLNRRGAHLTRTMVLIMLKQQALKAGITKTISPHTLRHSFATEMLKGGADIRFIQILLGHQEISTTEIYTHINNSMLREEILLHHPRNKQND